MSVVTMQLTVAGDVSSFDASTLRTNLLRQFSDASDAVITFTAGSITVTVRLIMPNSHHANSVSSTLASSSTTSLSAALGVTVTSASAPVVAVEVR